MSYQRGDVVWGPDPFNSGENSRPWLVLNDQKARAFGLIAEFLDERP